MQPRIYRWSASSVTAIAALQTKAAAGALAINGTMATSVGGGTPYVTFLGFARTITLTSVNNLSAKNFTITGTLNGAVQTETRVGPNNNTVTTTALFDSVTSITVSAAAAAVSVGTGATGRTNWFNSDYYLNNNNLFVQVDITGTITYSLQTTMDDVNTVASPMLTNPVVAMTGAVTDQIALVTVAPRYSSIAVTAGTGSLVATFIQQGVKV